MFRFTIRDVLWLTVVVGLGTAWYLHQARTSAAYTAVEKENSLLRKWAQSQMNGHKWMKENLERENVRADIWEDDPLPPVAGMTSGWRVEALLMLLPVFALLIVAVGMMLNGAKSPKP